MSTFPTHTIQTAPDESKSILAQVYVAFGSVPSLFAAFAESPALLKGYLTLADIFEKSSSFDATERQVVLVTASFENECHYCVAAHSVIARIQGVPSDVVQALRDGKDLSDRKLEALRTFTRRVVQERGWVAEENVEEFLHAGFSKRQVLEVILGVGLKTLSNYTNHIVKPPVDRAFRSQSWTRPSAVSSV